MAREPKDEGGRASGEVRPDFLRGQLRQWMDQVGAAGKTAELFELEMWLRSFERFFRIRSQRSRACACSRAPTRQAHPRSGAEPR